MFIKGIATLRGKLSSHYIAKHSLFWNHFRENQSCLFWIEMTLLFIFWMTKMWRKISKGNAPMYRSYKSLVGFRILLAKQLFAIPLHKYIYLYWERKSKWINRMVEPFWWNICMSELLKCMCVLSSRSFYYYLCF